MIVDSQTNIERTGMFGERRFTIKTGPKMFDLIIGGLYSNKIGAVVREVCSNAYDIHNRLGKKDVPFKVWLPCPLEPHFIVQDEGTGLSPEDIHKYYGGIGESSKENSNYDIGGFGLGAKSPFAYTDNFQIESRYKGRAYHFTTMKDEEGIPCLMNLGDHDTDEPDGLKISIPVAKTDYAAFRKELDEQLIGFDVKPQVMNSDNQIVFKSYPLDSALVSYDGVFLLNHEARNISPYRNFVRVVMGGVSYEVDIKQLGLDAACNTFIDNKSIVIFTEIGDVQITPSRESLEYKTKTVDFLNQKLSSFVKYIENEHRKAVDAEESPYSAMIVNHEWITKKYSPLPWAQRFTYRGKQYDSSGKIGYKGFHIRGTNIRPSGISYVKFGYLTNEFYIKNLMNVHLVYDDNSKNRNGRLKEFYNSDDRKHTHIAVLSGSLDDFKKALGDYLSDEDIKKHIIMLGDLPVPERVVVTRAKSEGIRGMTLNDGAIDELPEMDDEFIKNSAFLIQSGKVWEHMSIYIADEKDYPKNIFKLNGYAKKYVDILRSKGVLHAKDWAKKSNEKKMAELTNSKYARDCITQYLYSTIIKSQFAWVEKVDRDALVDAGIECPEKLKTPINLTNAEKTVMEWRSDTYVSKLAESDSFKDYVQKETEKFERSALVCKKYDVLKGLYSSSSDESWRFTKLFKGLTILIGEEESSEIYNGNLALVA